MVPVAMRHGHRGGILGIGKTCILIDITVVFFLFESTIAKFTKTNSPHLYSQPR